MYFIDFVSAKGGVLFVCVCLLIPAWFVVNSLGLSVTRPFSAYGIPYTLM